MNKEVRLVFMSVVALVLLICCTTDPAFALRGTWVLDHAKCSAGVPATYNKFTVYESDSYQITGYDEAKIEEGRMRNVTSFGFDYTMTLQTEHPEFVGHSAYARWQVTGGELSISFYSDRTMQEHFVTFVGTQ